jgi:hypothetical protein
VIADPPPPDRHCSACGRGHYVAVRFCPFCGAGQEPERAGRDDLPPPAGIAASPVPMVSFHLEPAPMPPAAEAPREPETAPDPTPPSAPPPRAPAAPSTRRPRRTFRRRQIVPALLAVGGLSWLALSRREALPAPVRIEVGSGWTSVTLAPFRGAPLLRITGDSAFSLRIDGDKVERVAPGRGATIRTHALRSLDLRAGRGPVVVTLTPRDE